MNDRRGKSRIEREWAAATGMSVVGNGRLARRAGGFVFGIELSWSRGNPRPNYEPQLFCSNLARAADFLGLSYVEPLRCGNGAPKQIPFGLHDAELAAAVHQLAVVAPAALDGSPVHVARVLQKYREGPLTQPAMRGVAYADMSLLVAEAEGVQAGLALFAEAQRVLPSVSFERFVAPIHALLRDPELLQSRALEALVRLKLAAAKVSEWSTNPTASN